MRQKKVSRKVSASIKEFNIGKDMLDINMNDMNDENSLYKNLAANMTVEFKKEKELDPRL